MWSFNLIEENQIQDSRGTFIMFLNAQAYCLIADIITGNKS